MNFLKEYAISVGQPQESCFKRAEGIRQDGTMAMYRDTDGKLWAISGHSNSGHIGMFSGTCVDDLRQLYPIDLNFGDGHASFAFSGIRYPEGIRPRGCVWPFDRWVLSSQISSAALSW